MRAHGSASTVAVRTLAPAARIAAVADRGSVRSVNDSFDAPRPSAHLARWGIAAQDDDGIVVARATIEGAHVLIAAQDERFLGGSAGANHADTLRRLFELARAERPAAVVVLAASGGVRLHEANAAEWALARALATLLDLRAAGVPVLVAGVADVFGGASVLACAAEGIALMPGVRLGLSGPAVIETARGRNELDAGDAATVARVFGAEARAATGHVELLSDSAAAVRRFVVRGIAESAPFATWVLTMQERLAARLAGSSRAGTAPPSMGVAERSLPPLPTNLTSLYADPEPIDPSGWLGRRAGGRTWLCRPIGAGTFGPHEAHALDAALLANVAAAVPDEARTVILIGDSRGHEVSLHAEVLCVAQYLAQHAAVLALLRAQGTRLLGLLSGVGHSAEFFSHVLQAQKVYALANARVVAMEPAAVARVTRLPEPNLAALIENDPVFGHPVRHFARWAGMADLLADANSIRSLSPGA
ncbi:MAG: biotin-independent malonate decarboxylase subunit gamma [Casimicrobiaceae bacterium]